MGRLARLRFAERPFPIIRVPCPGSAKGGCRPKL